MPQRIEIRRGPGQALNFALQTFQLHTFHFILPTSHFPTSDVKPRLHPFTDVPFRPARLLLLLALLVAILNTANALNKGGDAAVFSRAVAGPARRTALRR